MVCLTFPSTTLPNFMSLSLSIYPFTYLCLTMHIILISWGRGREETSRNLFCDRHLFSLLSQPQVQIHLHCFKAFHTVAGSSSLPYSPFYLFSAQPPQLHLREVSSIRYLPKWPTRNVLSQCPFCAIPELIHKDLYLILDTLEHR